MRPMMLPARQRSRPCIGISPLIGGKAVKGPLARLLDDLDIDATSHAVARRYGSLLDAFVVDSGDAADAVALEEDGLKVLATNILMGGPEGAERLAREVLAYASEKLSKREPGPR